MVEFEIEYAGKQKINTGNMWHYEISVDGEKVRGSSVWNCDFWTLLKIVAFRAGLLASR